MDVDKKIYEYEFNIIDAKKLGKLIFQASFNNGIIIYGANDCGCKCYSQLLYYHIAAKYFVDRNSYLRTDTPFFTPILSYNKFKEIYDNEVVIIASYKKEVCLEIKSLIGEIVKEKNIIVVPVKVLRGVLKLPALFGHSNANLNYMKCVVENSDITVVSIIYNTPEGYLRRAIESVLNQSYRNFRYLIIDHASDDEVTANIIAGYAKIDKRIDIIRSEKNYVNELKNGKEKDLSKLYRILEENIYSKYTCVLDSDDYYNDDFLWKAYEMLLRSKADTYFLGGLSYDEEKFLDGNIWPSFNLPPDDRIAKSNVEKIFLYANAYRSIGGWGMLTKTSLLLKGYREAWIGTSITSDLKVGYKVMLESKCSIFGGTFCMNYVNRKGSVTIWLKEKVEQRLDNIIELCLIKRIGEMWNVLVENDINPEKILYCYTEYNLMVLLQYLNELKQGVWTNELGRMINQKIDALFQNEYVLKVAKSRVWYRKEFKRLLSLNKEI